MNQAKQSGRFTLDARAVTVGAILLASAFLWWMMAMMPQPSEPGMGVPDGWGAGLVIGTSVMWVLMMLAMMLPAMTPVTVIYTGLAAKEHSGAVLALRVGAFLAGYFALWAVLSVILAVVQLLLRDSAWFIHGGTQATPIAAGVLMLIAGAYQFTTIKDVCLQHCRSPLAYLLSHWREGVRGAFPLGLHHGLYCVGCCVAIMGLMFVLGAMNPLWMAAIATYFVAEKLLPAAERWSRWFGLALILLGSVVTVAALIGMEAT